MLTHRQSARRKTRAWQIGAVACIGAAGAAIALPIEGIITPKASPILEPPPPSIPNDPRAALDTASIRMSSDVLDGLFPRHFDPPVVVETPETIEVPKVVETPKPVVGVWTYIGSIVTPKNKRALVRIDQQQHIFAEGSQLEDTRIVTITPTELTVETAGVQRVIPLADRTMTWPTDAPKRPIAFRAPAPAGGMMPQPQPMAGRPGMPPGQTPPMSADMARAQAMAESARRQQQGVNPPPRPESFDQVGMDAKDMAIKMLQDPNVDPQRHVEMLEQLGIKPGMQMEDAVRQLKESGIDVNDAIVGAIKSMESHAPADPNDPGAADRAKKREMKRGKGG